MNEEYLRFRRRFADALDPEWQDIGEVDGLVAAGLTTMWVSGKTALLTEVRSSPRGPVMFGIVCVGDMGILRGDIRPAVESWAREHGCIAMAFAGRWGWVRAMAEHGYKAKQVIMVKELQDG